MGIGTTKNSVHDTKKIKLHLLTLEVGLSLARNADEVHLVAMFTYSAETAYNAWKWRDQGLHRTNMFQALPWRAGNNL